MLTENLKSILCLQYMQKILKRKVSVSVSALGVSSHSNHSLLLGSFWHNLLNIFIKYDVCDGACFYKYLSFTHLLHTFYVSVKAT